MTDGKSKQRDSGHEHTGSRYLACAEAFCQSVALQAGDNCPGSDDHGESARIGDGYGKFLIHGRPTLNAIHFQAMFVFYLFVEKKV